MLQNRKRSHTRIEPYLYEGTAFHRKGPGWLKCKGGGHAAIQTRSDEVKSPGGC